MLTYGPDIFLARDNGFLMLNDEAGVQHSLIDKFNCCLIKKYFPFKVTYIEVLFDVIK